MLEVTFEDRAEKLTKDQLLFIAGAFEELAKDHFPDMWEVYLDGIYSLVEKEK